MGTRILWAIVIGFLSGVFARSYFHLGMAEVCFLALLGSAAVVLGFVEKRKQAAAITIAAALLSCALGVVRMDAAVLHADSMLSARIGKTVALDGVVFAEPDARDASTHISVAVDSLVVGTTTIPVHARVLASAPPHTVVAYGDRVRVKGKLGLPEAFDTGLGRSFDYPGYLAKDGIGYQVSFAQVSRAGKNEGNMFAAWAIGMKQLFLAGLHRAIPEPESGLAGGITVGDKRGPGTDVSNDFRTVGLVHIVVLSGYNITVVMNAVARIIQWAPRVMQFGAAGIVVAFFILMSGGASTAVRAGIMALLAVYARQNGRVYLALRALGVVAVGMVLWNPYVLAFDPGFQLSALATIGLVVFSPMCAARLQWLTEKYGLREIAASTLGTQLTVLPLLLYQNGQLPIFSLPANLLALPVMPAAMFFSGIAAFAGWIAGPLGPFVGFPAYVLLGYVITIAHVFAALPFATIAVPVFSGWVLALVYVLLLLFAMRQQKTSFPPHSNSNS